MTRRRIPPTSRARELTAGMVTVSSAHASRDGNTVAWLAIPCGQMPDTPRSLARVDAWLLSWPRPEGIAPPLLTRGRAIIASGRATGEVVMLDPDASPDGPVWAAVVDVGELAVMLAPRMVPPADEFLTRLRLREWDRSLPWLAADLSVHASSDSVDPLGLTRVPTPPAPWAR